MIKKGEYINYAQSLFEKMEDINLQNMDNNKFYPSIELEARLLALEKK